jgi:hypothetical protein
MQEYFCMINNHILEVTKGTTSRVQCMGSLAAMVAGLVSCISQAAQACISGQEECYLGNATIYKTKTDVHLSQKVCTASHDPVQTIFNLHFPGNMHHTAPQRLSAAGHLAAAAGAPMLR